MTVERRQNRRYRLRAPVGFSWQTDDGVEEQAQGSTRDISLSGIFVLTPLTLHVGTIVRLEVALPPLQASGQGTKLRSQGRVLRQDHAGFAAFADIGFRLDLSPTQKTNLGDFAERDTGHENRGAPPQMQ